MERRYLDCTNMHDINPVWTLCIAQTDTDKDSKGRTEFYTSTFYSATLPFLAQVLLDSFPV